MSTAGTALSFSIGAVLGAGWVNAFSKATIDSTSLADKTFATFSKSKAAASTAEKELVDFQKAIGNKTPTEIQKSVLNKLNQELEKTKSRLEQTTASISAWMSVSAATGKFKLQEYANATAESFSKLKSQVVSLSGIFSGLFFGSIANSARAMDNIGRTADTLGISFEALQRFQFAAAKAGISAEKFPDQLLEMNKRISDAAAGSGEAAKVLTELGLSAKALNGKDAAQKLELIVKAMGKVKNSADQIRYADKLFGGEAAKTFPALVRRGWAQIVADMDDAGAHILQNSKATEISRAYIAAVERVSAAFAALKHEAALSLMPALEKVLDGLAWLAAHARWLAPTIAVVTSAFVGFKIATVAFSAVVTTANAALTAFAAISNLCHAAVVRNTVALIAQKSAMLISAGATRAVAVAMGIWKGITLAATTAQWALNAAMTANPVGLLIVGIAALAAAIAAAAYAVHSNWDSIAGFFAELGNKISGVFGAAWASVSAGFAAAVNFVVVGIERLRAKLAPLISAFRDGFAAAWASVRNGFAAAVNFVVVGIERLWAKLAPLISAFRTVKGWISGEEPAAPPAAASAVPALSGAELESMSRAAISNATNVSTDARTFNTHANFTIVQQPGEDADALAQRVSARLAESYSGTLAAAL